MLTDSNTVEANDMLQTARGEQSQQKAPHRALPKVRLRPTTGARLDASRRRQRLRPSEASQDAHFAASRSRGRASRLARLASDGPQQPFLRAASAAPKPRHVADAARDPANCVQAERLRSAHAAEELCGQQRLRQARWRAQSDVPANGCGMSTMVHRGAQRAQVQRGGASCSGRVQVTRADSAAPRSDAADTCGSRSSCGAPSGVRQCTMVHHAASCTCRGRQLEARSRRCGTRGGFPAGGPAQRRRSWSAQQTLRSWITQVLSN